MNISKTPLLQQSTLRKTAKALTCGCILWTAASFLKQNDTYYNPISYEKQTYLHTDCEDSFHKLCETVDKQNGGIGCEVVKYWHGNDKSASEKFFYNTEVF